MNTSSLIDKLRRRVKDTRPVHAAMTVSISDPACSRAILELVDGYLAVTVAGGSAPSINLDLSAFTYNTVGALYQAISRIDGYTVQMDEDASDTHLSLNLFPIPPTDIGPGRSGATLRHYLFSDVELEEVLQEATTRHNPSFTPDTVPPNEEVFILQLAHAEVCRRQAYDSSKRKGLSETVNDLLQIAQSLEQTYQDDVKRLARSIESPKETTPNSMGTGDVVMGTLFRMSLRTGYSSPISAQTQPDPPVLLDPDDVRDIEDESIRFKWERNKNNDFFAYELWLDTLPDVERSVSIAGVINQQTNQMLKRQTTSKQVFRSLGPASTTATDGIASIIEELGQTMTQVEIGELEPETTYYARLYVIDKNFEVVASSVQKYRTKAQRTRFREPAGISPFAGAVGSTLTLLFDTTKAPITTQHRLLFGGKDTEFSVVSNYQATCIVPAFVNTRLEKDLTIISPNRLLDIATKTFRITE